MTAAVNRNASALFDAFDHGLNNYILDEIAFQELPGDLDGRINLANWLDSHLQQRYLRRTNRPESRAFTSSSTVATSPDLDPMQITDHSDTLMLL